MAGRAKISPLRSPYYSNAVGGASFTIGAETSNAITINVQLKDTAGNDLAVRGHVKVFLADDAAGDTFTATAAAGGIAGGTDGWLASVVTGKLAECLSEADGDLDVVVTHATGAKTWYLGVILPDGTIVMSAAVTFA